MVKWEEGERLTKTNRFDRLILTLFVMCVGVALAAAVVIYLLRAFDPNDSNRVIWLLITAACIFCTKPLMRLERQVRYHYSTLPYLILLAAMTLHTKRRSRAEKDSDGEGIM